MRLPTMRPGWSRHGRTLRLRSLAVLTLVLLLTCWPTASGGTQLESVPADSVLVPTSLLEEAYKAMDEKDQEIMELEAELDSQRQYYVELLELKDQRIEILEKAVKDALGSPTKDFLDKLLWGLAGFGAGRISK